MLTREENERYTRVGKGTPCGELMRRYWHPIAASGQLPEHGTKPVTILGERLVLYRDRSGKLGLVEERCPHRRGGMVFGIPEETGIRCAYHGWLFDGTGRCLEQPYEQIVDPESTFKDRVQIGAYPVEELGGLIFAYVGPEPAPLLPRWDFLVDPEIVRDIGLAIIPCNWLQCIENGVDGTHVPYLHGRFSDYVLERLGRPDLRRHIGGSDATTGWEPHKFGILKTRIPHGSPKSVGNPLLFPYIDRQVDDSMQIRVPMDDMHTFFVWYYTFGAEGQAELGIKEELPQDPRRVPVYEVPVPDLDEAGNIPWELLDNNSGQDLVMWHSQGEIADRTKEHLGRGDAGVILYRKLLKEQIQIVEEGGEPINTFRDPEANRSIDTSVDNYKGFFGHLSGKKVNRTLGARKYSVIYREAAKRIEGEEALSGPIY